jgi:hypothetical protein
MNYISNINIIILSFPFVSGLYKNKNVSKSCIKYASSHISILTYLLKSQFNPEKN